MSEERACRQQYSKDLKQRVIYLRNTLQKTTTEISILLDMPLRVVQRVLQTWDEIGEAVKDPATYEARGRPRLLRGESIEVSFPHLNMYRSS